MVFQCGELNFDVTQLILAARTMHDTRQSKIIQFGYIEV